jgi:hypothetical protein
MIITYNVAYYNKGILITNKLLIINNFVKNHLLLDIFLIIPYFMVIFIV